MFSSSDKDGLFKIYVLVICSIILVNSLLTFSASAAIRQRNLIDDPKYVDLKIGPIVSKGIIPFDSVIGVTYYNPGSIKVKKIFWDLNGDGVYEKEGFRVSQQVTDAIDQDLRVNYLVETYNTQTGTTSNFTRSEVFDISGYNALLTLTFDDGHKTVSDNALQILNEKSITGTAYIVPAWVDWNSNYMSWEEIQELEDSGWDIGSHGLGSTNFTYCIEHDIPLGTQCNQLVIHPKLSLLNQTRVIEELSESRRILQEQGFSANNFAYPHGGWNQLTYELTNDYYSSARITNNSINSQPGDLDKYLISVKGTNDALKTQATYEGYIDEAIQSKGWLILNNHIISEGNCDLCISPERLSNVIDYAKNNRVKIINVQEAVSGSWKKN